LQVLKLKKDLQAGRRRMQRYHRGLQDKRPEALACAADGGERGAGGLQECSRCER